MGPSTSNPSPADQEQSVAAKRRPPSFRSARHGNRFGQTRSAAAAAALAGIGRGRPRLVQIAERGQAAVKAARQTEATVEAEWTAYLGKEATAGFRHALARLREIADPYQ